ncbi:MAG: ABC transporter permease [Spirochaetota bacterium]
MKKTTIISISLITILLFSISVPAFCQEKGLALWDEISPKSKIPLHVWISDGVDWLAINLAGFFDFITDVINIINTGFYSFFSFFPTIKLGTSFPIFIPLLAFVLAGTSYLLAGWKVSVFTFLSLFLLFELGLWQQTIQTLSLTLTAAFISLVLGIPLGIWAGKSDPVEGGIRPVLDFMQTMPVFVYLIPAVMFFGIGVAPGVVATIIFAIPPAVRLTSLGIREIPVEVVEAGESFGCNAFELLWKVELPMARVSIMAGVNQTIMLSLSMVVIAALIGAGGLGGEVVKGIQRMMVGRGIVAGIAVVFVAIILDRMTRYIGQTRKGGR